MNVSEHRAMAFGNHNRLVRQPVTHLRERMPDMLLIQFGERMHFQFSIYDLRFTISFSATARRETSAAVCAAVSVTRNRALPRATVG